MTTYDGFDTLPIAGQWRVGRDGNTADDVNPYSGDVLTTLPLADAADVDAAFTAASIAQRDWESTLPTERADVFHRAARIMEERKDEIVDWLVAEVGAIRPRAEWEWLAVRAVMLESASYPTRSAGRILPAALIDGKENRVYRRPLGVVTVISPWNFPMQLSARSVAPALALGNAVVLKPASDTPVTGGLLLTRILEDAGLPAGLLSVVVGKSSEIGDAVTSHPLTRLVSFTGSTPVGSGIAASAPLTRMSLELGGNGPLVVLEDADVEAAVNAAVFGSFFHQGQVCMATNRVIAADAVHDEVVDRLTERVRSLRTGDPADPDTQIGPIINDAQVESILDRISRAESDGAEIRVRGERSGPAGRVLGPHLVLGTNGVATAAEEVFGPVATVIRADKEDDAVRIANDTEYGLSSAVFSRDVERAVRVATRLDAGMTHVNDTTINDEPNTAFGGEKNSGIGRFGGEWAIDEFTTDHWISVQHTPRQYAI
ncbi:aldehyde dehydrogenase family protein [Rhodococcus sp. BP-149]|uniref:aldehyde dehydrogenase family protein n=1 Tax=unclassified Rhodococcus (in: high G+C Gram-positive bacteria) TaxID=192944 RepID=UPI001C9AAB1E|nr:MULTISPECIES: aldehyde dehydrogenase family protein [unclassified Rhodococcus (in: high G+C Gram-positive bacteria)]MBY6685374.1 aldehyde dehydrogenase family protein [Rhodococcus sp. BP-288]MBY6696285.1 aldehyde dehydrogenase family protein [Rhodococcus sp. BP-188]MBY6696924.1 aldehyde dehydrogenase family protein [Rhodococcus sp. BP-285]MBY6703580.1 aldehyde dehydrogenase family protein [Rhodococcus sp. BP-283]MBY6710466.1 aldehyde dehydrogenase family protein [Rhodococcus sp. BP-160]